MFYVLFHIYRSQHSKMQQYFPLIKTKQNFCVLVNMIYLLVYFSLQIYSFSSKYWMRKELEFIPQNSTNQQFTENQF